MFELNDVLAQLRRDLYAAVIEGRDEPLRFEVDEVELELSIELRKSEQGSGGISIYVAEASLDAESGSSSSQTLRLKLSPAYENDPSIAVKIADTSR